MSHWNLSRLLENLHKDIQGRLEKCRECFGDQGAKGAASEGVWLELLDKYLPKRYQVASAFVVDSHGKFSDQIDVLVFDRQYSPFIFRYEGQIIVPAESVYAVFEAKQSINSEYVKFAQGKVASVRHLYRTSLPIPYAKGVYPAKPLIPIIGGILTFESDWKPAFGLPIKDALAKDQADGRLDIGCVAAHGHFSIDSESGDYGFFEGGKPATAFLFKLIWVLQSSATVPMIDIQAYAKWLNA